MKAILHIGVSKTGSTTIQHFLASNRKELKHRNIYIPVPDRVKSHNTLVLASYLPYMLESTSVFSYIGHQVYNSFVEEYFPYLNKEERTLTHCEQCQLWGKICCEVETNCSKDDIVIFSAELLSLFHEDEVEKVRKLMISLFDDVTIVVYLRRQPEYIVSGYNTSIDWHGAPCTIKEQIPPAYDEIVKLWTIFGKDKIKIRLFDTKEFHDNDLLSDFAITCGFDITGLKREKNQNETTMDSAELEFLRLFNSHVPRLLDPWTVNPDFYPLRQVLLSSQENREKSKAYRMSRSEAQSILEQCRDGNDWVAREYLGREKLFSEDVSMYPETVDSPHGLTLEKCVEISAHLWKERCNVIHQLQQKNQQLKSESTALAELPCLQEEIKSQQTEIQRSHDDLSLLRQKHSIYWHYYRYKVLAKITFGKKRKHYKEKRNAFHEKVRQIRDLCRGKSQ